MIGWWSLRINQGTLLHLYPVGWFLYKVMSPNWIRWFRRANKPSTTGNASQQFMFTYITGYWTVFYITGYLITHIKSRKTTHCSHRSPTHSTVAPTASVPLRQPGTTARTLWELALQEALEAQLFEQGVRVSQQGALAPVVKWWSSVEMAHLRGPSK